MATQNDREEHYVVRVQDRVLAARLRTLLQSGNLQELADAQAQLHFQAESSGRTGRLCLEGEEYPAQLLDLPTILESYKTFNDVDLVKSNDIGQVILVREKGAQSQEHTEYKHGITPPMQDVRNRMFKTWNLPDPAVMRRLAQSILAVSNGQAPEGMEFTDVEEEFQVDEHGHGTWVALPPDAGLQGKSAAPLRKPSAKGRRAGGSKKQPAAA